MSGCRWRASTTPPAGSRRSRPRARGSTPGGAPPPAPHPSTPGKTRGAPPAGPPPSPSRTGGGPTPPPRPPAPPPPPPADSEMMSAIRLRRLIAEDAPVIAGYDEALFAKALTRDRPIAPSIEAMRWAREASLQILERLTDAEWDRKATHEESGAYSVDTWLEIYAAHPHEHAAQIRRSRGIA